MLRGDSWPPTPADIPEPSHGRVFPWKVSFCLCGEGCMKLAHRSVLKQIITTLLLRERLCCFINAVRSPNSHIGLLAEIQVSFSLLPTFWCWHVWCWHRIDICSVDELCYTKYAVHSAEGCCSANTITLTFIKQQSFFLTIPSRWLRFICVAITWSRSVSFFSKSA